MDSLETYKPKNKIRIVTAASLFDGHDASINIMRRILQSSGAEIIHLGHNRSVSEIVETAIQEDVQAIAVTSYQGGHIEFFKYMYDLLKEKKSGHIKIFGGGGGTILPTEIKELEAYGICKIYSPDDGRRLGLQGMINDLLSKADFSTPEECSLSDLTTKDFLNISRCITAVENERLKVTATSSKKPVLGITGTGGAGKSSVCDELVRRFVINHPTLKFAVVSVDPTRKKSGGALLGDRIRMNAINHPNVFMRSMATREANASVSRHIKDAVTALSIAGFDLIIVETSGIGQSDIQITELADISLYVMTPEYGAASQLEKIDMLDFADVIAINKSDKKGSEDALRDVKKQYRRNHNMWDITEDALPVIGTIASRYNDEGINSLFSKIVKLLNEKTDSKFNFQENIKSASGATIIIPSDRTRYLAEISEANERYNSWIDDQCKWVRQINHLEESIRIVNIDAIEKVLSEKLDELRGKVDLECKQILECWYKEKEQLKGEYYTYKVRKKDLKVNLTCTSVSGNKIPKISLPDYSDKGDILRWLLKENLPGHFPFTSGVFPFKRTEEDPTRMFAGEGIAERTNRRFHYLSKSQKAKRLSTAFDSVTLYGEDPDIRPDIYGKVGNSGVSIATLDDAKRLYSGFNLSDPTTSVSMTINGPAPMLLSFFLNTAIDQQCELYIKSTGKESEVINKFNTKEQYRGSLPEGHDRLGLMLLGTTGDQVLPKEIYEKIKADTLKQVRGTVQADILKEDQAQNTCIFSTPFALKMMGDVQQYFIEKEIKNFYSVSISGYHIAEAGANPITQLAFTLANGFTYVEYYLSRGMHIDDFAPNFSFFFSNGLDPEYAVIGRVARRIWAKAIKNIYRGNERSQKLKYHIQTSGRSLHAQEIAFNDIRTTLQALYAIYDNCNSLHTNAYDEAITTPTEESVRRAVAIQLIINKESGLTMNENPLQGAFIINELTDLVEEAVMMEFKRISERGGVPGAMELMYQRSKIQEESHYYESIKHSGKLPIIGVNTFLDPAGSPTIIPDKIIRATDTEKQMAISHVKEFKNRNNELTSKMLHELQYAAINNQNIFNTMMEVSKYCSLGEMTHALYQVGGQYRRNM
ncbi:MAG: methylmalonyl-CoA mutase family protein [Cytophagaceae bacterium]